MSSQDQANSQSFEASMQELESIVKQMEQGELPLEQALVQFERGIKLARMSQQTLKDAEQKVQVLLQENGEQQLSDFDPDSSSS